MDLDVLFLGTALLCLGIGAWSASHLSNAGAADVQDLALSDGRPLWQYLATLVDGLKLAREIVGQSVYDGVRGEELTPGADARTDDQLARYVRETAETLYHPVGTCRMGSDERAVVDPQLRVRGIDGLQDVNSDLQITNPQLRVEIKRDRASALGITPQQIEDTLYSAYGSRQVSTIYTPTNQYFVIMEMAPEFQQNPEALSLLYLVTMVLTEVLANASTAVNTSHPSFASSVSAVLRIVLLSSMTRILRPCKSLLGFTALLPDT